MKDLRIVNEGYPYTPPENYEGSIIVGVAGIAARVGQALLDLNKALDELPADEDSIYRYFDNVYASGVLLEMDGMPLGIVQYLDDIPQFVEFHQGPKITDEDEEKS